MKPLLLIALEACYGIVGFMLYHARRLYQNSSALESDLVVLYGPFFVTVIAATCILSLVGIRRYKPLVAFGVAFGLTLIVGMLYLGAAINAYGE